MYMQSKAVPLHSVQPKQSQKVGHMEGINKIHRIFFFFLDGTTFHHTMNITMNENSLYSHYQKCLLLFKEKEIQYTEVQYCYQKQKKQTKTNNQQNNNNNKNPTKQYQNQLQKWANTQYKCINYTVQLLCCIFSTFKWIHWETAFIIIIS